MYVWNTPWKFGNAFVNGAFGGWMLSENFFVRSGLPLTVLDGTTTITNFSAGDFIPAHVVGVDQGTCSAFLIGSLETHSAIPRQDRLSICWTWAVPR